MLFRVTLSLSPIIFSFIDNERLKMKIQRIVIVSLKCISDGKSIQNFLDNPRVVDYALLLELKCLEF